jgi:phosphohistidine phosphatase
MDLVILRHGKAGPSASDDGDAARALTTEGRDAIRKVGLWMQKRQFRFDLIATSPLARACETAGIVAGLLGQEDQITVWDELGPSGSPDAICLRASQAPPGAVILMVGHEPDLSALIGYIITAGRDASVALAKGGLAKIRDFSHDTAPSGELEWLLTPDQVAGMQ